ARSDSGGVRAPTGSIVEHLDDGYVGPRRIGQRAHGQHTGSTRGVKGRRNVAADRRKTRYVVPLHRRQDLAGVQPRDFARNTAWEHELLKIQVGHRAGFLKGDGEN
ncbi:unnamed protein product, partial [Ectocarpus sp. 13 AM-2016]